MRHSAASLALAFTIAAFPAACQVATPEADGALSNTARSLSQMPFEGGAPVTVRGRISTLVWPVGSSGMLLIEAAQSGEKFAFSTANVPDMAKQGFTRFALRPGAEVTVTGVLAAGNAKIGPGLTAARADLIANGSGAPLFDRSRLPK